MGNLSVNYAGIAFANPILASSSPFTSSLDRIQALKDAGIGGVVLKSVFEEQISGEAAMLERYSDSPEAADYLKRYIGDDYIKHHLTLVEQVKKTTDLPVIASINCLGKGTWTEYARRIEEAGADALELNIFFLPTDPKVAPETIEKRYLDVVADVVGTVRIPVTVKLSSRFTNILHVAQEIYFRGAKGVVLFNRFFEPDINIDTIAFESADNLSHPSELRNSLRNVVMMSDVLSDLDIAVSTGVHSGRDAIKAILAGASAVQVCSTLHINGLKIVGDMLDEMKQWMRANGYKTVPDFKGILRGGSDADNEMLARVQYMRYFPSSL